MMEIGNLRINGNIALAPMAGYTDSPFRLIAREFGAALVISELVSAEGIVRNSRNTLDLLRFSDAERPVGIQLFGNDPGVMAEAARAVEQMGPDFIDINIGCPARRVLRGGSGAALLSSPDLVGEIASRIRSSVSVPVSAKIRIGVDADNKNYAEIANILQDSGISFISVHGRTRSQGFKGDADWGIIREIKGMCRVPVLGNGDIGSYQEALKRLDFSGCDAVMIGRAAVGNPWIFTGHEPSISEIFGQMKKHLDLMLDFYGGKGVMLFRKHAGRYIRGMNNSAKLRAVIMRSNTREEVFSNLDIYAADQASYDK
jgi:tRNA-dihydrouridine synthase B